MEQPQVKTLNDVVDFVKSWILLHPEKREQIIAMVEVVAAYYDKAREQGLWPKSKRTWHRGQKYVLYLLTCCPDVRAQQVLSNL